MNVALNAPLKSEGQRLLRALGRAGNVLAKELRVTNSAVSLWLSGSRKPTPDVRRDIEKVLGIAASSWDTRPTGQPEPAPAPAAEPTHRMQETKGGLRKVAIRKVEARADAPPVPRLTVEDPLASVRALVERCRVGIQMQGLTATEAKSWQDQLLAAMKMAQVIQHQEELRADVIARHPEFRRLWDTVAIVLKKHPDALRDVVAALGPALS